MPIFEYLCGTCGEKSEKIQPQALERTTCTHCGNPATRIVSLFAPADSSESRCTPDSGSGFG